MILLDITFETFRAITKPIHIGLGAVILATGIAQIIMRKAGRTHRKIGALYFWCMFISFLTSFPASVHDSRHFLSLVGLFSIWLAFTGMRMAQIKIAPRFKMIDRVSATLFFFANLVMIGFVLYLFLTSNTQYAIILGVFSGIFAMGAFPDFYFLMIKNNPEHLVTRQRWIYTHIGRMIGSFIAATTAFLVNVQPFGNNIINWLLPSALGVLLIRFYIRKYKKQYGKIA